MTRSSLAERFNIGADDITPLRQRFAQSLEADDWAASAWQLGRLSETPSTAFFFAYQLAVRHLDPSLGADQFAALAASESGVRHSREFTTHLSTEAPGRYRLSGEKSHIMLLQRYVLDCLYVLANNEKSELVCVRVATDADGLTPLTATKPQPFVCDVPHAPVGFDRVLCSPADIRVDAHRRCFKPFRYWEDVMVVLSMAGWMSARTDHSSLTATVDELAAAADVLATSYRRHRNYYQPESFAYLDEVIEQLDQQSACLNDDDRRLWQRDRTLLQLGAMARQQVRNKLLSESLGSGGG